MDAILIETATNNSPVSVAAGATPERRARFEAAGTVDAVGPGVTGTSVGGGVTALLFSLGGYAGLVVAQPREHQLGGYAGAHVSDHQGNVTGYAHGPEAALTISRKSALPAAGTTNAAAAAGVSGRYLRRETGAAITAARRPRTRPA